MRTVSESTFDNAKRARIFEHLLRRLVSAHSEAKPLPSEWWNHEFKGVEKALVEYGSG